MGTKQEQDDKRKEFDEVGNSSDNPINDMILKANELFRLMVEGNTPTFEEWEEKMKNLPVTQEMLYYAIYKKF